MANKTIKVISTLIVAGQPHGPNKIVYSQQAIEDMAKNNPEHLKVWQNKLKCMIELDVDEKYLKGDTNVIS